MATKKIISAKTKQPFIPLEDFIHKQLQDPAVAQAYLELALHDEDPKEFLTALKNVLEAQKKLSAATRKTKLAKEELDRLLAPRHVSKFFAALPGILNAVGLQLTLEPKK
jgi:DNA-binding phage protein